MKKSKESMSQTTVSVFTDRDGKSSNKPSKTSIFGESHKFVDNIDVSREYLVFAEAKQPSQKIFQVMIETFGN